MGGRRPAMCGSSAFIRGSYRVVRVKFIPNLVIGFLNFPIHAVVSWQVVNLDELDHIGVILSPTNAAPDVRGELGRDETFLR
jgi:hypothetical protein